jgi:DNA-binding NarL/FixJ family response regulator
MRPRSTGRRRRNIPESSEPVVTQILRLAAQQVAAERVRRAPTEPPIRVLIVDSERILMLGLASVFARARSCHVVGQVGTTEEAVRAVRVLRPDVVILGADLPDGTSLDVCQRMRAEEAAPRIVLLASTVNGELVVAGIKAGASGYLLKQAELGAFIDAVETVAAGSYYVEQASLIASLEWLRTGTTRGPSADQLSEQQRKILALIAQGKTNGEIATDLNLSIFTVKTYVSAILRRLGLGSRAEAAAFLVRNEPGGSAETPPTTESPAD